jgi:hypothetical protein
MPINDLGLTRGAGMKLVVAVVAMFEVALPPIGNIVMVDVRAILNGCATDIA